MKRFSSRRSKYVFSQNLTCSRNSLLPQGCTVQKRCLFSKNLCALFQINERQVYFVGCFRNSAQSSLLWNSPLWVNIHCLCKAIQILLLVQHESCNFLLCVLHCDNICTSFFQAFLKVVNVHYPITWLERFIILFIWRIFTFTRTFLVSQDRTERNR